MDSLSYLFLLEERDFLLFWYGWSRLDSVHGECWMGGRSYKGLAFKLCVDSRLGWGDWLGVRGANCGAAQGDIKEPSTMDCEDTGGGWGSSVSAG